MPERDEVTSSGIINEKTAVPLSLVIVIIGGIIALAAQWFEIRSEIQALDAKKTAEVVAVNTRVDSMTESAKGDHRLLCAIAGKLHVENGECP